MPLSSDSSVPDPDRTPQPLPEIDEATAHKLAIEYCECGRKLLEIKEYDRAKSAYQTATEYDPKLAIAHSGLAQANYDLGNYSAALVAIDLAIDSSPRGITFYDRRATIIKALNQRSD